MTRPTAFPADPAQADLFDPTEPVKAAPEAAELLALLDDWCAQGWLRRLDVALARWLADECPQASVAALLAAALLAQREGRGHTCIELTELLAQRRPGAAARADDEGWLDGPAVAQQALAALLQRLPGELADWMAALRDSGAVETAQARRPGAPLRLEDDGRLYLRRHWRDEQAVAQAVRARVRPADAVEAVGWPTPDPAEVRRWLDRLFSPRDPKDGPDWQRIACAVALRGRLALITGGPGTGKTYTVARLLALGYALHPAPRTLRIALAAPTGKAAARLKQSIDLALQQLGQALPGVLDWADLGERLREATTLHRLLGARPDTRALRHDARHPLEVDLLVVDEASMVHLEMMSALLAALPASARLVLLGDRDQLASVEAGAVLGDFCRGAVHGHYDADSARWIADCTGQALPSAMCLPASRDRQAGAPPLVLAQQTVMLRESRRFGGAIGRLALAVNDNDVGRAAQVLRERDDAVARLTLPEGATESAALAQVVALALDGRPGAPQGYAACLDALRAGPDGPDEAAHQRWVVGVLRAFDRFRLLCALREGDWGVSGLNALIEARARARWRLAAGEWYAGRPVMVSRNDAALGVFNGDIGMALPGAAPGHALRVFFPQGGQVRSVGVTRLAQVETAFAMTVHKSQGSEFEHTALVLSAAAGGVLGRELVYTGITRARQAFTLLAERPGLLEQAIASPTRRASGLPRFLDGWPDPVEPEPTGAMAQIRA